jgi:hypothetical protein
MSHFYDSSGVLLSRFKKMMEVGDVRAAVWRDVADEG